GKGEVVDAVHPAGDLDLLLVVRVVLYEDLDADRPRSRGERRDEVEGLGDHERGRPRPLDREPGGVEAHHRDAGAREGLDDPLEVGLALWVVDVDVDLLRSEGIPEKVSFARTERHDEEGKRGPKEVQTKQVRLAHARRKDLVELEEEAGERRRLS